MHLGVGELVGWIDLLPEPRDLAARALQLGGEGGYEGHHIRMIRSLCELGELLFVESAVLDAGVRAPGSRLEIGQPPNPAVGADHVTEPFHQTAFGGGVIGVPAGDLGDQADHGAGLGFGDR